MAVSRKAFIKSSSFLIGGLFLGAGKGLASMRFSGSGMLFQEKGGFKPLRNDIGIFTAKGGTIGWYVSNDAAAVIDTQFPDTAKDFMNSFSEQASSAKRTDSNKIDFLLNTHHHRDHTAGNFYLKQFADKIIAQENCPVLQKKAYGTGDNADKQVYADTLFSTTWEQSLGKEKISALYLGAAHTGGDAIYHFENANIVHLGDLVFNNIYPNIDQSGGGSIKGWIDVLDKAIYKYSNDTLFIFGHADTGDNVTGKKDVLVAMENYFNALLDFVGKEIKSGKTLDQVKEANEIPGFSNRKENWKGALAINLEAAYNELKKV